MKLRVGANYAPNNWSSTIVLYDGQPVFILREELAKSHSHSPLAGDLKGGFPGLRSGML